MKTLRDLYEYVKNNPHEQKRFDQCFNCKLLETCNGECEEDENGMCKMCEPLKGVRYER